MPPRPVFLWNRRTKPPEKKVNLYFTPHFSPNRCGPPLLKMKKTLALSAVLLLAASFGEARAQSLLDILNSRAKSSSTEQKAEQPPVEKINKDALTGVWNYSGAAVEFTGNDLVATLGSSMAAPSIKQSLETYYAQAGLQKGSCTLEFKSNDKYAASTARDRVEGPYSFDHQNQKIKISYEHPQLGGKGEMDAHLKFAGDKLQVTFEAAKIVAMIREMTKGMELDQNVKDLINMISEYKGLYLGFEMEK